MMDTLSAFVMGEANRGNQVRVFDWDKAAMIIRERSATSAHAGLQGDWEWTGGQILVNGTLVPQEDTYVYLASTWAIPELEIDGETEECWTYRADWDAHTYWPESALVILEQPRELPSPIKALPEGRGE